MKNIYEAEEKELWKLWIEEQNIDASEELIRRYMSLVHYHLQRILVGLPRGVSQDDLLSYGLLGLYDALSKFKPELNLKFDTYASFRVRGSIIDGLRKEDWMPRTTREKIKRIEAVIETLQHEFNRSVSSEEVAEELGFEVAEVEQLMAEHFFANLLSIDETNQESERQETYAMTIEDKELKTPEEHAVDIANKKELAKVIEQLTKNEQLVISLYYYEGMTLTEIGEIMQLSTSRISQIHSKAIFKMQQVMIPKEGE